MSVDSKFEASIDSVVKHGIAAWISIVVILALIGVSKPIMDWHEARVHQVFVCGDMKGTLQMAKDGETGWDKPEIDHLAELYGDQCAEFIERESIK